MGKEEGNEQRTEGGINRRVKAVKKSQISSKSTKVDGDSDEKMIDKLAAEMEMNQEIRGKSQEEKKSLDTHIGKLIALSFLS